MLPLSAKFKHKTYVSQAFELAVIIFSANARGKDEDEKFEFSPKRFYFFPVNFLKDTDFKSLLEAVLTSSSNRLLDTCTFMASRNYQFLGQTSSMIPHVKIIR